jgi:hypothetical protein
MLCGCLQGKVVKVCLTKDAWRWEGLHDIKKKKSDAVLQFLDAQSGFRFER